MYGAVAEGLVLAGGADAMKVRHKATSVVGVGVDDSYEVVWETPDNYLCITNKQWGYVSALPKSHYEPIPAEPHWQDVTGECDEALDGGIGQRCAD